MILIIFLGILVPFIGTCLGSSLVFFIRRISAYNILSYFDSFAAGIMIAASFFSLINPALENAEKSGSLSKFFCVFAVFIGISLFIVVDKLTKCITEGKTQHSEGLLFFVVTLHNIPEGMALGVVYSCLGSISNNSEISSAMALSVAIALQNIPEGAIISLTKHARGKKKINSFIPGVISGVAELSASCVSLIIAAFVDNILPFSLCFAAGAMIYTVLKELSSGFCDNDKSGQNLLIFALSFALMMFLDIVV